jgi:hypothetical protein
MKKITRCFSRKDSAEIVGSLGQVVADRPEALRQFPRAKLPAGLKQIGKAMGRAI